jgi:hypothetical protein
MLSLQEQALIVGQEYSQSRADHGARLRAIRLFRQAYLAAWWHRLWAVLTGRGGRLRDLAGTPVRAYALAAPLSVTMDRILGSEGRARDYDSRFRPLDGRDELRWVDVATAWLMGEPLPPVDLIQIGDTYYVRDGHHRVSIARALGQREIDAQVVVWEV